MLSRRTATLCSRNVHKARELEVLLPGWTIHPLEADEWPPEVGETYYENARAKAQFGHRLVGGWTIGEDSGLEVQALDGRPGVHTARYAPAGAPAIAKLLGELGGVAAREARYVSELVALSPKGDEVRGTGTLEGHIADEPRGNGGFGYDPVFVPDGMEQTVAELGDGWKNRNSHRARAAKALFAALGAVLVLAGCGSNNKVTTAVLRAFFANAKMARPFSARYPHKPGALPCTVQYKGQPVKATCSADVTLVKKDRAVITLTEAWNHGALAHTWFFFVKHNGFVQSVVQEGSAPSH